MEKINIDVKGLNGKPSVEKKWLENYPIKDIDKEKPNTSLYEYMYLNNSGYMNDYAFSFFGSRITYEEFLENIDKVSRKFVELGVHEGDVIPLIMANIPESAYCFYALNKIGAVACMIDPRLNEYGLARDLNLSNSEILVSIKNACKTLKSIKNETNIKDIIMLSAVNSAKNPLIRGLMNLQDVKKGNRIPKDWIDWHYFISNSSSKLDFVDGHYYEGRPAAIVFTGGTTGVHKGVVLSDTAINTTVFEHHYLIDNVKRGEKFLDILPPFIAYGLTSLHLSLCFGLETILDPVSNPKNFVSQIIQYHPSIVFGGPIHWETLINNSKLHKENLSFLKFPVSGGEKLPMETANKINKVLKETDCNTQIFDGYGASECCGVFSLKFASKNSDGTVGFPLRFNDMCILDSDTGLEKDYNQMGDICIYGPSIMNGYYKNEEETNKVFIIDAYGRKWLKTGDLGMINEAGELVITGRSKRIFVCGVNKVYPPEMEALIMQLPEVHKCVVTGVEDNELRTVPKVHIILEKKAVVDNDLLIQKIKHMITQRLGCEVIPKYYSFDEEFLYTGSGKIDYVRMTVEDNEKLNGKIKCLKREGSN